MDSNDILYIINDVGPTNNYHLGYFLFLRNEPEFAKSPLYLNDLIILESMLEMKIENYKEAARILAENGIELNDLDNDLLQLRGSRMLLNLKKVEF